MEKEKVIKMVGHFIKEIEDKENLCIQKREFALEHNFYIEGMTLRYKKDAYHECLIKASLLLEKLTYEE